MNVVGNLEEIIQHVWRKYSSVLLPEKLSKSKLLNIFEIWENVHCFYNVMAN